LFSSRRFSSSSRVFLTLKLFQASPKQIHNFEQNSSSSVYDDFAPPLNLYACVRQPELLKFSSLFPDKFTNFKEVTQQSTEVLDCQFSRFHQTTIVL
jgi:hypothetical protein